MDLVEASSRFSLTFLSLVPRRSNRRKEVNIGGDWNSFSDWDPVNFHLTCVLSCFLRIEAAFAMHLTSSSSFCCSRRLLTATPSNFSLTTCSFSFALCDFTNFTSSMFSLMILFRSFLWSLEQGLTPFSESKETNSSFISFIVIVAPDAMEHLTAFRMSTAAIYFPMLDWDCVSMFAMDCSILRSCSLRQFLW